MVSHDNDTDLHDAVCQLAHAGHPEVEEDSDCVFEQDPGPANGSRRIVRDAVGGTLRTEGLASTVGKAKKLTPTARPNREFSDAAGLR